MDARDARPHRAGYLADLELPSCRARARAGSRLLRRGACLPGPGSRPGGARKTGPVGRPVCRCPCGPPPMSRAVGIPHEVDRTAQNQEQFLQNRRIRYGLLHSVTRCSVGVQKAAAALRFRQDDNGIGGQAKSLAMAPAPAPPGECGRLQNSEGWGPSARMSTLRRRCRGAWSTAAGQPAFGERFAPAAHHIHIQHRCAIAVFANPSAAIPCFTAPRSRSSAPGRTQRGSRIAAASRILATLHRGSPMNPHPPHGLL